MNFFYLRSKCSEVPLFNFLQFCYSHYYSFTALPYEFAKISFCESSEASTSKLSPDKSFTAKARLFSTSFSFSMSYECPLTVPEFSSISYTE